MAANTQTKQDDLDVGPLYAAITYTLSSSIVTTDPESWQSFYPIKKGRRLRWPVHYSYAAQSTLKGVM